jgi:hypothetical protein
LGFTNRKRKYFEEKTTATLKSKQTSIATVRNHLQTLASSPTPLIFHWSLPLTLQGNGRHVSLDNNPTMFTYSHVLDTQALTLDEVGHICHVLDTQAPTLDEVGHICHIFHILDTQALTLDEVGHICHIFHIFDSQALTLDEVGHIVHILDTQALT